MTSRLPIEGARAFLLAAESGSFAAAAQCLRLSAGAISQRIQALEAFSGETLFDRAASGTRLTEAGRRLYEELREPLHAVEGALTRRRTRGSRRRLHVSAAPAFAARWLMPRLSEFSDRHPDVELHIDADPRPARFDGPIPDLAIRYGRGPYAGMEMVDLYRPRAVICAQIGLVKGESSGLRPDDLVSYRLLRHGPHQAQWGYWLAAHGVHEDSVRWGPAYSDDILLREALLAGQGVGLAREPFVREDIDRGALIQLFDAWLPEERYWLVGPPAVFERSAPAAFRDWLLGFAETGRA